MHIRNNYSFQSKVNNLVSEENIIYIYLSLGKGNVFQKNCMDEASRSFIIVLVLAKKKSNQCLK